MPKSKPSSGAEELTKRQAILRAAAELFLQKGYRATSMEMVAIESGAGRQTVYNQFASKKSLFDATMALLWDAMPVAKIVSPVETGRPCKQVLIEIGNAYRRFLGSARAEREVMSKQREFLSGIAGSATSHWDRYSKSEVRNGTSACARADS